MASKPAVLLMVGHVMIHSRENTSLAARTARAQQNDALDLKFGYERHISPHDRVGWLINIHPVSESEGGGGGGERGSGREGAT